jgi:hypothetical protein
MNICPVCNGLIEYVKHCKRCGAQMEILDRWENYYDDYSPYLSYELTDQNDGDPSGICSHVSICSNCGERETAEIRSEIE